MDTTNDLHENIIESLTSGLMVIDSRTFQILSFNKALERITGLSRTQVLNRSVEEVFSYVQGLSCADLAREMWEKGVVTRPRMRVTRPTGEDVYRGLKAEPLYSRQGEAMGIVVHIEDVTEREILRESFSRYVAHQVVEAILSEKQKLNLSGCRQEVTILFADIRGFTELAESQEPEAVVSLLNGYFSRMVDVVLKYEGTLDKFVGDTVMAVFGAPMSREDDTERALRAAIEMQSEMVRFNAEREEAGEEPIHIGIGINTGIAIVGNVGSEKRMDYTVIGDAVNVADRIQNLSRGGEILVSEHTYRKASQVIRGRPLSSGRVRGRVNPVKIYLIEGLKEEGAPEDSQALEKNAATSDFTSASLSI
ncbi:MAG: PAS domain S-box protein [Candidatus Tectomicrobia bacterium]|uniref:PAS domain S-box protein n=1 Tax=Tectimicrobiota bacterium TaxID=2528274 RepID=A0A932GSF4_UNCTE|nr:PAS domain S-box protein [Candidatus Tectomicrobia bacterium]